MTARERAFIAPDSVTSSLNNPRHTARRSRNDAYGVHFGHSSVEKMSEEQIEVTRENLDPHRHRWRDLLTTAGAVCADYAITVDSLHFDLTYLPRTHGRSGIAQPRQTQLVPRNALAVDYPQNYPRRFFEVALTGIDGVEFDFAGKQPIAAPTAGCHRINHRSL